MTMSFWAMGLGAAAAMMRMASLVRPAPCSMAWLMEIRPWSASASNEASQACTWVTISCWVAPSKTSRGIPER